MLNIKVGQVTAGRLSLSGKQFFRNDMVKIWRAGKATSIQELSPKNQFDGAMWHIITNGSLRYIKELDDELSNVLLEVAEAGII